MLDRLRKHRPAKPDWRALMDRAVGADAVRALRRQMAEQESPAALRPDEHRIR